MSVAKRLKYALYIYIYSYVSIHSYCMYYIKTLLKLASLMLNSFNNYFRQHTNMVLLVMTNL